jgi:hypothetical protein
MKVEGNGTFTSLELLLEALRDIGASHIRINRDSCG